jgi:methylglutaconyl-CoA hydratase
MTDEIRLETDARGIATLWLARAAKHNALSRDMLVGLIDTADRIAADASIRAVVLAAEGRTFCAGGDLDWMRAQMAADPATRRAEARLLAEALQALDTLPKPLIGRVQGNAFGGGVGLISVCDVAIAADGTRFGLTETRLGLIPATIGPYVAARLGVARARGVFMSARLFGAAEAATLGLVARAVPPGDLDAAVMAEAEPYLACAPGAVADAKALLRALGPRIDAATIDMTIEALAQRWESPESVEGIAAFFDRRDPAWKAG